MDNKEDNVVWHDWHIEQGLFGRLSITKTHEDYYITLTKKFFDLDEAKAYLAEVKAGRIKLSDPNGGSR